MQNENEEELPSYKGVNRTDLFDSNCDMHVLPPRAVIIGIKNKAFVAASAAKPLIVKKSVVIKPMKQFFGAFTAGAASCVGTCCRGRLFSC